MLLINKENLSFSEYFFENALFELLIWLALWILSIVSKSFEHSFCPTIRSREDLLSWDSSLSYKMTRLDVEFNISFRFLLCVLWDKDLALCLSCARFTILILWSDEPWSLCLVWDKSKGTEVWFFYSHNALLFKDFMLLTWDNSSDVVTPWM